MKLLGGYLLSLPLYFLTLAVLYHAWGGTAFHPLVDNRWIVYLSATPQFYAMVLLVFYLTTWRTARWILSAAVVVFAGAVYQPRIVVA